MSRYAPAVTGPEVDDQWAQGRLIGVEHALTPRIVEDLVELAGVDAAIVDEEAQGGAAAVPTPLKVKRRYEFSCAVELVRVLRVVDVPLLTVGRSDAT